MSMFTTPKSPDHSDELGKSDLLDCLAVFKVTEYEAESKTRFGTSATVRAHVTVIDGAHAGRVEPMFFAAGNLARQIGEALDPGQMAPGRIVTGKSSNGKDWFGIEWATSEEDLARAEAALSGAPAPAAPAPAPGPVVMEEGDPDLIPF